MGLPRCWGWSGKGHGRQKGCGKAVKSSSTGAGHDWNGHLAKYEGKTAKESLCPGGRAVNQHRPTLNAGCKLLAMKGSCHHGCRNLSSKNLF